MTNNVRAQHACLHPLLAYTFFPLNQTLNTLGKERT